MGKPKPERGQRPPAILTWADAEAALGRLAGNELEADQLRNAADVQIKQVREVLKEDLDRIEAANAPLRAAIEEFAREHKDEMAPLKSRQLRFGRVGFRDEPKFRWPKKLETLVDRLKQLGLDAYIRVREEPDKAAIMAHWDKEIGEPIPLDDLGVKRVVERDVFYIELKSE